MKNNWTKLKRSTMKPSKEIIFNKTFWDKMFKKMRLLLIKIERTNPSIDDTDLRWVSDRCEYYESEERILSKGEMETANNLYRKFS